MGTDYQYLNAFERNFFDGVWNDEFLCIIAAESLFFVEDVSQDEVEKEGVSFGELHALIGHGTLHFDGIVDDGGAIFFVEPCELHLAVVDVFESVESFDEHLEFSVVDEFRVSERGDEEDGALFGDGGECDFPQKIEAIGIGPMDIFDGEHDGGDAGQEVKELLEADFGLFAFVAGLSVFSDDEVCHEGDEV